MQRHVAGLKEQIGSTREEIETNVTVLSGRDVKADEILATAMVPPFLGAGRLVIVEGLLDRFEGGSGGRGAARSLGAFDGVVDALGSMPPTNIVVITGGTPDKRRGNALLARLKDAGADITQYPELKGESLFRHIREEASLRGIKFQPGPSTRVYAEGEESRRPDGTDPVRLLADLHAGDTLSIANELDKLALYTNGRPATVDDIAVVCSGERAFTNFNFTDAVLDGNLRVARQAYAVLDDAGTSEQALLALLANAYRTMAVVADLKAAKADEKDIAREVPGGSYPNLLKRALVRAGKLGGRGAREAYEAILDTDRSIKSGLMKPDLAMELLVVRLCSLVPSSGRR